MSESTSIKIIVTKKILPLYFLTIAIGAIIFIIFQAFATDQIDNYFKKIYVGQPVISLMNYIIFIYTFIIFFSFFIPSMLLVKNQDERKIIIYVNLKSAMMSLVLISVICFIYAGYGLRGYFTQINLLEKIFAFYLWNAYFMAYILKSAILYFAILIIIYFYNFTIYYVKHMI